MGMRKVCASCQTSRLLTDGQHYQRGKVKRWICTLCIERKSKSQFTQAKEKVVIPRVEMKAIELIEAKLSFNKYYLSAIAHCDQRTAQRALTKLHKNNKVVIKDWFKNYKHWIPIYGRTRKGVVDKPKPLPIPRSEIAKKYNADVEHQIDRLMRDRARRTIKRIGI